VRGDTVGRLSAGLGEAADLGCHFLRSTDEMADGGASNAGASTASGCAVVGVGVADSSFDCDEADAVNTVGGVAGAVMPLLRRTPSRRSSATSLMTMSSESALLGVLPSMLLQKGQPTARTFSPVAGARVCWASRKRLSEMRSSPSSSSFQNWAPPAPQQKEFSRLRGSSGVEFERMLRRLRGAS